MGKVYRQQIIEGVTIPSIIHNMHYYWNNMAVYQDGTVNCWKRVNLDMVPEVIQSGWLVPQVPVGQKLSIFELGNFPIEKAEWQFNDKRYFAYIEQTVRSMNPDMENVYKTTQKELESIKKYRTFGNAESTPFKQGTVAQGGRLDGKTANIFYQGDEFILTSITAFRDRTLQIDAVGEEYFQLEEIEDMFAKGVLCTRPQPGQWVSLGSLGQVMTGEPVYYTDSDEKLEIIRNMVVSAAGEKDAEDKCQDAYFEYLREPSEWNREVLRKTYEAVPESRRMYLGDMDTRDWDFIRILYHPDQKREV